MHKQTRRRQTGFNGGTLHALHAAVQPVAPLPLIEPLEGRQLLSVDLVADVNATTWNSDPRYLTPVGDVLYFTATTADAGNELWRSDGTSGGTRLVADLVPGPDSSNPLDLIAVGDRLFFLTPPAESNQHDL